MYVGSFFGLSKQNGKTLDSERRPISLTVRADCESLTVIVLLLAEYLSMATGCWRGRSVRAGEIGSGGADVRMGYIDLRVEWSRPFFCPSFLGPRFLNLIFDANSGRRPICTAVVIPFSR